MLNSGFTHSLPDLLHSTVFWLGVKHATSTVGQYLEICISLVIFAVRSKKKKCYK